MRRRTLSHLRQLLDSLPVQPASTGIGKLRSFWSAAHDEAAIDAAGLSPLAPLLAACELFATDRAAALGRLHGAFGVCAFFSLSVAKDAHADVLRLRLQPAGLTLLSSTPYLHAEHGATRLAYVEAVGAALSLLGLGGEEAQAGGAAVLRIETALAAAERTAWRRAAPSGVWQLCCRRPAAPHTRRRATLPAAAGGVFTLAELSARFPGLDWRRYLALCGAPSTEAVVLVESCAALAAACRLMQADGGALRYYLLWCAVCATAEHLPAQLAELHFSLLGRTLAGQRRQPARWECAVRWAEEAMGALLGELYVQRHLSSSTLSCAHALVGRILQEQELLLRRVPWLEEGTRRRALVKLGQLRVEVGMWQSGADYAALDVRAADHLGNVLRARAWSHARRMRMVGRRAAVWCCADLVPTTVNAAYYAQINTVVIPAAMLQPPLLDPSAEDVYNLAGLGTVVGHEITHAFDGDGRRYDEHGCVSDWWTAADAAEFERRLVDVVDQSSSYAIHGQLLDGNLVADEVLADFGGVKLAFAALRAAGGEQRAASFPRPARRFLQPIVDLIARYSGVQSGVSVEQQFFLAYARQCREEPSPKKMWDRINVDSHGPSEFRVNAPLANMPAFYHAFGIQPGNGMWRHPNSRFDVW
ncbi:hypothetical protein AB1Y20_004536 [Prymnesium parvum]